MKADIREVELYSTIDPNVPERFNTDPRKLKQILINLIANAIKFTFKGHIKISALVENN